MNRRNFLKGAAAVAVAAPVIAEAVPVKHNWADYCDFCMCCGASRESVLDNVVTACGDVGRAQWEPHRDAMRFKDPSSWYLPDYPGQEPVMFHRRRTEVEPFTVIYGSSS